MWPSCLHRSATSHLIPSSFLSVHLSFSRLLSLSLSRMGFLSSLLQIFFFIFFFIPLRSLFLFVSYPVRSIPWPRQNRGVLWHSVLRASLYSPAEMFLFWRHAVNQSYTVLSGTPVVRVKVCKKKKQCPSRVQTRLTIPAIQIFLFSFLSFLLSVWRPEKV